MITKNRYSIAHPESLRQNQDDIFYNLLKNSSKETLSEIYDIFFAKFFYYEYDGQKRRYGNCMGVEANDRQVDNLFKIQDELGIPISLTLNTLEIPHELLMDISVQNQFIDFIGSYYERGLRSCTIASTHMMRDGNLQRRFPEMRWKNTVNHIISDAQKVVDMIHCGYDTIQLDRSLNRNINELKKIKIAVDRFNENSKRKPVHTFMLIAESCVYGCPFKKEHDDIGTIIAGDYFTTLGMNTCSEWRQDARGKLPRVGVDLIVDDAEDYEKITSLVDVFKTSGRASISFPFSNDDCDDKKMMWNFSLYDNPQNRVKTEYIIREKDLVSSHTLQELIDSNARPLHLWGLSWSTSKGFDYEKYTNILSKHSHNVWVTEAGRNLTKILFKCKSQCWDCHKCEETFGVPNFDSVLEL